MRYLPLLLSLLFLTCGTPKATLPAPADQSFFLGTYTTGESEGIYHCILAPDGSVDCTNLAAAATNPSYLAYNNDRSVLVAVEEEEAGMVRSFRVNGQRLTPLNGQPSGGAHPCHVSVSDAGYVAVSNYTGGNVELLKLETGGNLSEPLFLDDHRRLGGEKPHAHSTYFTPGNQLITADLGTDELWRYRLDPATDKLVPGENVKLRAGAGPRHLAFHPNGEWVYSINELNSTVTLLKREGDALNGGKSWSTLPPDFTGESFCADIHVSSDGRYLYGSNRGHNSIVVFAVNQKTGALIPLEYESVVGDWPRNFALSPDERFLLVANQRSENITTLSRDAKTGMLEFVGEMKMAAPVCILF